MVKRFGMMKELAGLNWMIFAAGLGLDGAGSEYV